MIYKTDPWAKFGEMLHIGVNTFGILPINISLKSRDLLNPPQIGDWKFNVQDYFLSFTPSFWSTGAKVFWSFDSFLICTIISNKLKRPPNFETLLLPIDVCIYNRIILVVVALSFSMLALFRKQPFEPQQPEPSRRFQVTQQKQVLYKS